MTGGSCLLCSISGDSVVRFDWRWLPAVFQLGGLGGVERLPAVDVIYQRIHHVRICFYITQELFIVAEVKQKQEIPKSTLRIGQTAGTAFCLYVTSRRPTPNPQKIVHCRGGSGSPPNTSFFGPTGPIISNGISIQSTVFPEFTVVTNGRTDRQNDHGNRLYQQPSTISYLS